MGHLVASNSWLSRIPYIFFLFSIGTAPGLLDAALRASVLLVDATLFLYYFLENIIYFKVSLVNTSYL